MIRAATAFATHYRLPWNYTPSGLDILTQLLAAGLPGALHPLAEQPSTRVMVHQVDGVWEVEVVIPGDDESVWAETVQTTVEGSGT